MKRSDEEEDDPEVAHHLGQFAMGAVTQLSDKGYPHKKEPIGFNLDPKAYKKKRKKK